MSWSDEEMVGGANSSSGEGSVAAAGGWSDDEAVGSLDEGQGVEGSSAVVAPDVAEVVSDSWLDDPNVDVFGRSGGPASRAGEGISDDDVGNAPRARETRRGRPLGSGRAASSRRFGRVGGRGRKRDFQEVGRGAQSEGAIEEEDAHGRSSLPGRAPSGAASHREGHAARSFAVRDLLPPPEWLRASHSLAFASREAIAKAEDLQQRGLLDDSVEKACRDAFSRKEVRLVLSQKGAALQAGVTPKHFASLKSRMAAMVVALQRVGQLEAQTWLRTLATAYPRNVRILADIDTRSYDETGSGLARKVPALPKCSRLVSVGLGWQTSARIATSRSTFS